MQRADVVHARAEVAGQPDRRRCALPTKPAPGSWSRRLRVAVADMLDAAVDVPVGIVAEPLSVGRASPPSGTSARSAGDCRSRMPAMHGAGAGRHGRVELGALTCCRRATGRGPASGCAENSASMPVVCALGTLNTMRDEQLPASSVTCRSLDLVVEDRGVEGDAALRIFDAGFIVPQRLVVVGAWNRRRSPRPRRVQSGTLSGSLTPPSRKPLAAWTLTLRLSVRLPASAMTRGLKPFDLVLSPMLRVAVREEAAGDEVALFLEVVIAAAGGQLELAEVVAAFAEQRLLLDVVGQVGVVRRVRAGSRWRRRPSAATVARQPSRSPRSRDQER